MKDINEMSDESFLNSFKVIIPAGIDYKELTAKRNNRLQDIIDRLKVPEDIEEVGRKLHQIWGKRDSHTNGWDILAAYIWPHLATGLRQGDRCYVSDKSEEDAKKGGVREGKYIGKLTSGLIVVEYENGLIAPWRYAVPIPKTEPEGGEDIFDILPGLEADIGGSEGWVCRMHPTHFMLIPPGPEEKE